MMGPKCEEFLADQKVKKSRLLSGGYVIRPTDNLRKLLGAIDMSSLLSPASFHLMVPYHTIPPTTFAKLDRRHVREPLPF